MNLGDFGAAAHKLEALRVRSDAPGITNYYLGHAYLRMGKNADARAAFQRFAGIWEGDKALVEEARAIADRLSP